MPGDFKNNPLYTDITKLDHLSPAPVFNYNWNKTSGFWQPAEPVSIDVDNLELNIDFSETNRLLSGVSGELSNLDVNVDFSETNRLLSGVSGELSNIDVNVDSSETNRLLSGLSGELSNLDVNVDSSETNRLLSGVSGELSNLDVNVDFSETNKILSGMSGELSNIHIDVEIDSDTESHRLLSGISGELRNTKTSKQSRALSQPWKLRTKTVNQKFEEDFILLESIPDNLRYGAEEGSTYGKDKSIMDDIYGTHFNNARMSPNSPETGHPDFFIHSEYTPQNRGVEKFETFHSDTLFGLRQENVSASLINSYELEDFNSLYKRGLAHSVTIFNNSPYPIQFHTSDRRYDKEDLVTPENKDLIYLNSEIGVTINNDEAGRIFIKRPHTISGFSLSYSITYKETGIFDIIPSDRFNIWEPSNYIGNMITPTQSPPDGVDYEFNTWGVEGDFIKPLDRAPISDSKFNLWETEGEKIKVK